MKWQLPPNWELVECVEDSIEVFNQTIHRTGMFAKKGEQFSIGAASGVVSDSNRAYCELLERIYTNENLSLLKVRMSHIRTL